LKTKVWLGLTESRGRHQFRCHGSLRIMPGWCYLFLTICLYGFWAVGMKVMGDKIPVAWAALIYLVVSLPVDIYLLKDLSWPAPSLRHAIWAAGTALASILASLCYLRAAREFTGPVLTASIALYPLVALPLFAAMGDKPSWRQMVGVVLAAVGGWLLSS
jgi:drug/metabolite transporter (DMT)-like permease